MSRFYLTAAEKLIKLPRSFRVCLISHHCRALISLDRHAMNRQVLDSGWRLLSVEYSKELGNSES